MRQWKRLLAGVSLGVCTFAMAAMFSVTGVSAAEIAGSNLAVDYDEQQLTVKPASGDKEIYVTFPAVKDVKTKDRITGEITVSKKVTVKAWDVYDATATVDLSNLSPLKETYVMVKGTVSEPVMIHFTASISGMKLTYDGANDKVTFMDKKRMELWGKSFQYRSPYGSWKDYTVGQTKLGNHAQQGSTVYFREKPTMKSTGFGKETTTKKIDGFTTYEAGHFAGAEAKVKITKRANGPKVTVDYVNHFFYIPLGTEYRFNYYQTWTPVSTYQDMKGRLVASPVDLTLNTLPTNQGGMFEVRYAAVDTDKKKTAPSKYTQVAFEPLGTVVLNTSNVNNTWDIVRTIVLDSSRKVNEVTFEYVKNAKSGRYTGVKFTNVSNNVYEIAVADSFMPGPEANLKQVSVVNAKNTKGVAGTATLALPKYEGKYVWVRIKADAKAKKWASSYVCVGKIITPSPTI